MASRDLLNQSIAGAGGGVTSTRLSAQPGSRLRGHRWAWVWAPPSRIAFLSLAGLATGSAFLGRHSLWLDEAFSVAFARAHTSQLWHRFGLEINMALYHGVLHFWLLLGSDAVTVRMLSVLFAVATVPILYCLVGRLYDDSRATAACALLVVNPFFVQYAQEARAYSLSMFFATVTTYLFVRAVQTPSRMAWVAYALVAGLAAYVHLFLGLVIVAQALSLSVTRGRPRVRRSTVAAAYIAIALLASPVAYFAHRQAASHLPPLPKPTATDLLSVFMLGSGQKYSGSAVILFMLAAFATVLFAIGAWKRRRGPSAWTDALILSWFAVPIALSYVGSFARPSFALRYLIVSMPALLVMAAVVILPAVRHRLVLPALAAVLALSLAVDWAYYHDPSVKENWRALSAYLVHAARPGDGLIVYQPYLRTPLDYYIVRHPDKPPVTPIYPSFGFSATDAFATAPDVTSPAIAHPLVRSARRLRRVWIVLETNLDNSGVTPPAVRAILSSVAGRPRLVDRDYRKMLLLMYGPRRG